MLMSLKRHIEDNMFLRVSNFPKLHQNLHLLGTINFTLQIFNNCLCESDVIIHIERSLI